MADLNTAGQHPETNFARTMHASSKRVTALFFFDSLAHFMPRTGCVWGSRPNLQLGLTSVGFALASVFKRLHFGPVAVHTN